MKKLFFLLFILPALSVNAASGYRINFGTWNSAALASHFVLDFKCSTIADALQISVLKLRADAVVVACVDPAQVILPPYNFTVSAASSKYSISYASYEVFVCTNGESFDLSLGACVLGSGSGGSGGGVLSGCVPSIRTIGPCPSGFAPSYGVDIDPGSIDQYESELDTLPLQDMLYAIGICLFGLIGILVGVKLV